MRALQFKTVMTSFQVAVVLTLTACGLAMSNDDRLDRAQAAFEAGEYRAAIVDAKGVLRDDPDNVRGRVLLGRASIAVGDGATAEKEFGRALALGVPRNEIVLDLAKGLLQQGKSRELVDEIAIDPSSMPPGTVVRLQELRASAHMSLGQPAEARELYTAVLAAEPDNVDAKLGVASSYVAEGNGAQGRATLDEVLASHGDVVRVWLASGALNLQLREAGAAEANFAAALALAEKHGDATAELQALTGLSDALLAQGKSEEARNSVARLVALAPESAQAMLLEARIAFLDRDWVKAQQNLQRILRSIPDYAPAQVMLGAVQLESGNLMQAEMYLSAVVAADPDNPEARKLLAETRLRMHRLEEAQETLRPMVSADSADPHSLSIAARASVGQGRYDEAIQYLERSLAAAPGNRELEFQLATAYLTAGRLADAEATLNAATTGGSEEQEFRKESLLALTRLREGRNAEALELARLIADKYSDRAAAFNLLASMQLSLRQPKAARESLARGLDREPDNVMSLRLLAAIDEAEGDLVAAKAAYERVLELESRAAWAMYALARIAVREQELPAARDWLERVREVDAGSIQARLLLARLAIEAADYAAAEGVLEEVFEQDETNAEAHNLLGLSKLGQKDAEHAAASFRRATELDADSARYRLNLARAQKQDGDNGRALQTLESGPTAELGDIRAAVMLASLKAEDGDRAGAMRIARRLQSIHPQSPAPHALQAELHLQDGDLQAAATAYDRALEIKVIRGQALRAFSIRGRLGLENAEKPLLMFLAERPLDNEVRLVLAQHYHASGRTKRSIEEYETIVASDPANGVAMNNLAWAYQQAGDPRAESTARRAHQLLPDNASVLDTLGWILVESGSTDEAEELLKEAVRLSNGQADMSYHLAVALSRNGKIDAARRSLEELLEGDGNFANRAAAEDLLARL